MENKKIRITYLFKFDDKDESFTIDISEKSMALDIDPKTPKPEWTKLSFCKCADCDLADKEHPHCHLALAISEPVMRFKHRFSTKPVSVYVKTPDRIYFKRCDLQTGFSSLLGLLMSTSGCPHFQFLRPTARFHMPFATYKENIFKIISMHLLHKYYTEKENFDFDLNELIGKYDQLESVNIDFAKRLRFASDKDSTMNAFTNLDLFAQSVSLSIEDHIEDLLFLFEGAK